MLALATLRYFYVEFDKQIRIKIAYFHKQNLDEEIDSLMFLFYFWYIGSIRYLFTLAVLGNVHKGRPILG